MEEKIRHLLASLVHPETGQDIVSSGFIEHIASAAGKITVVLRFAKARDPFAVKIKNQAESLLREAFPGAEVLWLSERGIEPVEYRETEHYQVTKRFLSDPERMLRHLLGHA